MRNFSSNLLPLTPIGVYNKLYKFYGPQGWWPGRSRFEVIVGAILTQNTAWSNVEKAIRNLKSSDILPLPLRLHKLGVKRLARLIRPAGYYNVKTKRLRNFTTFLKEKHGGDLNRLAKVKTPRLREELLAINGIGPETCDSILLYAFSRPVFVVDAYTKRILDRHGMDEAASGYEAAQKLFMENLPTDAKLFNEYHALIVRLAKDYCRTRPRCEKCPLKEIKILAKHFKR